jgi:hypothetical protein
MLMSRLTAAIAALIVIAPSLALAEGIQPLPNWSTREGTAIWLAGEGVGKGTKPKPPVVVTPPKTIPPGAHDATKGQTGKCICSTNAKGNTTCTGAC